MDILKYMTEYGHEQLVACSEPSVGLKAFIVVHDTTLGPGAGGLRIWPYQSEDEAILDVLRLSRAMTYKSAVAGLSLGGGKAVVIADPAKDKTEAMMRAYGRYVETLGGRYITTTDVGSTTQDLEYIALETKHVAGLPTSAGGSGDTSELTGLGLYRGMQACAKAVWGSDSLSDRMVAMQGFGKVAQHTAEHLLREGAILVATDIQEGALDKARQLGVKVVEPDEIYDVACDIFSPCALGGVLNSDTIPRLKCRIVAGGANNQLQAGEDCVELQRMAILYAPDYVINAGGIINVSCEVGATYSLERARAMTEGIYETVERVLRMSSMNDITTAQAAERLAEERLDSARKIRSL